MRFHAFAWWKYNICMYLVSLWLVHWPSPPWLQALSCEEPDAGQALRLLAQHAHITHQSYTFLQVGISFSVPGFWGCGVALPDSACSSGSYRHVPHYSSSMAVQSGDGTRLRSPSSSLLLSCPPLLWVGHFFCGSHFPHPFLIFLDPMLLLTRWNRNSFQTATRSHVLKMVIKGFVD